MSSIRTPVRTMAESAFLVAAAIGIGAIVSAAQTPTYAQPRSPDQGAPIAPPAAKAATKPPAEPSSAPPQQAAQPAAPSQPAATQPPNVFDDHVHQGKITKCATVFGGLGRIVAGGATYSAKTSWHAEAGDAHAVQSIVALSNLNPANPQAQRAAGVVVAAPVGNACEGTLVRVVPTTDNCQLVAAELAKQNGQPGVLGDMTLMALPGGGQVMLVPLGSACVAVSVLQGAG